MKINKVNFFKFFLTFTACSLLSSCNNKTDYNSIIEKYSSEELLCTSLLEIEGVNIFLGEPYTGSCLTYNDKFTVKTGLESYVNGKIEGVSIGYYPSGEVDYIGYRENGEINGDFVKFHQNGEIAIQGQFSDGFYVGTFYYYDEKGEITERNKYNEYGELIKSKKY
jgi:antitoxin component YwqK of YwqJK toxin-antitoxin module